MILFYDGRELGAALRVQTEEWLFQDQVARRGEERRGESEVVGVGLGQIPERDVEERLRCRAVCLMARTSARGRRELLRYERGTRRL